MNMTQVGEHERKIDNDEHYIFIYIFGKIHRLMFVIVVIFILFCIIIGLFYNFAIVKMRGPNKTI